MKAAAIDASYTDLPILIEIVTSAICDSRRIGTTRVGLVFSAGCSHCSTEFRPTALADQVMFADMPIGPRSDAPAGCRRCGYSRIGIKIHCMSDGEAIALTKHRLFQKMSPETRAGISFKEIALPSFRDAIVEAVNGQIDKARSFGHGDRFLEKCKALWAVLRDDICVRADNASRAQIDHHKFEDAGKTGVYLVASMLPWSTEIAIARLASLHPSSMEYTELFTKLFVNNWPAGVDSFLLLIWCNDPGGIQVHTGLGASPSRRDGPVTMPIELLSAAERRVLHL